MMVLIPDADLAIFTVKHIIQDIGLAVMTVFYAYLLDFLTRYCFGVHDSRVEKLGANKSENHTR